MPRPYQILEKPIYPPYVCIQCGVGEGRRDWFLDLGFTIDQYFNVDNQAIYLCNECYTGMTLDVSRLILAFKKRYDRWENSITPTYSYLEQHHDVRVSEPGEQDNGIDGGTSFDAAAASSSNRNDQDTESNNPEPESTDSGDADSVDDSDSNESTGFSAQFGSQ